jgi:rhodanese-related sulfurtransferase
MFNFFRNDNKKVIHVNDIDPLLGKINLIDIREPYEYKSGTIKTAKNIPMGTMLSNPDKYLSKDKEYYIMCHSGARSSRTCSSLIREGYNVVNISGGMASYVGTKRN